MIALYKYHLTRKVHSTVGEIVEERATKEPVLHPHEKAGPMATYKIRYTIELMQESGGDWEVFSQESWWSREVTYLAGTDPNETVLLVAADNTWGLASSYMEKMNLTTFRQLSFRQPEMPF